MRRLALLLAITVIAACKPTPAPTPTAAVEPPSPATAVLEVAELSAGDARKMLDSGELSSHALTQAYLDRIGKLDKSGPTLNSIIELNPDALKQADALDAERKAGKIRGPLHGIPVLLKDNIDAVGMANSAGSLAMADNRPQRDAFLVARLRAAGAVILGKTNLSEWANFRSTRSTSGWSSRGGQTKNAYVLDRNPCGSSSGTGTAIAASLAAVGVGTETDGSIICPASGERPGRAEADRRRWSAARHHPDLGVAGHGRSDGSQRGRCRHAAQRDRRRRRERSLRPCRGRKHSRGLHDVPEGRCAQGQALRRAAPDHGLPP